MAFDFENLEVYKTARLLNKEFLQLLKDGNEIPRPLKDQLLRAASSIMLNIAEGSGRFSRADKRNFYVIARGSVFECVAIIDILRDAGFLSDENHQSLYQYCEAQSRKLWGIIQSLNKE